MKFKLNEDQVLLQDMARRFLADNAPMTVVRDIAGGRRDDAEIVAAMAEQGWFGLMGPPDAGGGGVTDQPLIDAVALAEVIGESLLSTPAPAAAAALSAVSQIEAPAPLDLQAVVAGAALLVPAIAEAEVGWDLARVGTKLETTGASATLTGQKVWLEGADHAAWFLVAAQAEDGLALCLAPRTADGVELRPMANMDVTRRSFQLALDRVDVPEGCVLAKGDRAREAAERLLDVAATIHCGESVGAADAVFRMTVEYAKTRKQFGRAIGSFQAIKHKLADAFVLLQNARAVTYFAALALCEERRDARAIVSAAKSFVADAFSQIAGHALQIHGGVGFTWEHDVGLYLRRAKSSESYLGDIAFHRERLLAARGL